MITKPKGTYDVVLEDARIYQAISKITEETMANYNYDFIRTPIFEDSSLYHRSVGDSSDIVTKETYDFRDRGDRSITLRPEGTAGVVRSFIENKLYGNRNDAVKLFYNGTMYRYERPQAGRNREFTQIGAEVFGSNEPLIDAEVISLGYNLLKDFGLEDVVVSLNTLGDKESRSNYTKALCEYLEPNLDNLCDDCKHRFSVNPLRILDCKVDADSEILKNVPKISDYLSESSKKRFKQVRELLTYLDIDVEIDEKMVRGLDYYDENVWEYKSSEGVSLGGGGRYNSLVGTLDGPDTPAIGFALGVERIMIEMKNKIKMEFFKKQIDAYVMCVNEEEKIHASTLVQELRLNGIRSDFNSNDLSLKSQFKIADGFDATFLVILNSEDLQKGIIKVKDNHTKEEFEMDESEVVDWIIGNL